MIINAGFKILKNQGTVSALKYLIHTVYIYIYEYSSIPSSGFSFRSSSKYLETKVEMFIYFSLSFNVKPKPFHNKNKMNLLQCSNTFGGSCRRNRAQDVLQSADTFNPKYFFISIFSFFSFFSRIRLKKGSENACH